MSKELPFFKFVATEWLSGDIVVEALELQGIFINICALYWKAGCRLPKGKLDVRFRPHEYELLVERGLMKVDKNNFIEISFLNEQLKDLSKKRKSQIEGGRKGGLRSAQGKLKVTSSIEDKEEDKDNSSMVDSQNSSAGGTAKESKNQLSFEDKYKAFIEMFNEISGRKFRGDDKSKPQFKARLKVYNGNEMREAVRKLYKDPKHREKNFEYATPAFITRAEIMERYVVKKD
jgi:hypothetical protein